MNPLALSTCGYISISQSQFLAMAEACPVSVAESQAILIKALELPLPPSMTTEAIGIHQSDIIIRSAIIAAIADLRANDWLIDYVFASLPRDPLTMNEYGEQEVAQAKKWFKNTNINVVININPNEVKFPCISIGLNSSAEDATTLGDVHYQPIEDNESQWPVLVGPITPTAYDATSGIMTVDASALGTLVLAPKMVVIDKVGRFHEILVVLDDNRFQIKPGTIADFGDMVIKTQPPAFGVTLESAVYRETYAIGVHVDSEPVHLTYLHSILTFCLLRYKQSLLEARGLERTTLSSADFRRDDQALPEFVYSRYIQMTGYVRQYWPKHTIARTSSVLVRANPVDQNCTPSLVVPETDFETAIEGDALTVVIKGDE